MEDAAEVAVSSSAPRCGPSSVASASVSGVKPEMSAKRPAPCDAVGHLRPGGERAPAIPGDVRLGVVAAELSQRDVEHLAGI